MDYCGFCERVHLDVGRCGTPTLKMAKALAKVVGYSVRKTTYGEIRIVRREDALLGDRAAEDRAYYADSVQDALNTMHHNRRV